VIAHVMNEVLKAQRAKLSAAVSQVDETIRKNAVPGVIAGVLSLVVLFFGMPVIAGTLMGVTVTLSAQIGLAIVAGVREGRILDRIEDLVEKTKATEAEAK
jgi:hypothetical protein